MVTIFLFLVVSSVAAFSTDGRWNSARELWDRSWNSTGLFCWLFFGASAVASVCIGILDFTIIIYSFHLRGTNSFFFYHFFIFYPFTVLDSNVVRLGKQRCRCLVFPFFFFVIYWPVKKMFVVWLFIRFRSAWNLYCSFSKRKWKTTSTMLFLLACCHLQSETDLRQSHCTLSELDDQHFNTSKWRESNERERTPAKRYFIAWLALYQEKK